MKKVLSFILMILNDVLFLIGSVFVTIAAYRFNINIGLLVTGVFFIFYALLLSHQRG